MPPRGPRFAVLAARRPAAVVAAAAAVAAPRPPRRLFHASRPRRHDHGAIAAKNHYERLRVRHDASPAEIKKSFYALSKTHHPDANPTDRHAAHTFALLSESYALLSNPSRRAAYDRDVLRLHHHPQPVPHHHGSYASTSSAHNPAGGRAPSGLSRRRGTFRGPPPSFYRSGGWGAHGDKRRAAHEESTGGGGAGGSASASSAQQQQQQHHHHQHHHQDPWAANPGMGPGSSPFHHPDAADAPHFDHEGHTRTHQREDRRRWQRTRRAVGDDDVEFEPQTSLAGHFLIVAGILGATFLAPFVYLQFMRFERRKKERDY